MLASMGSFHIPTLLAEAVSKKKGKQKVSQWEDLTGESLYIHTLKQKAWMFQNKRIEHFEH